jgi:hypothetical protein
VSEDARSVNFLLFGYDCGFPEQLNFLKIKTTQIYFLKLVSGYAMFLREAVVYA